METVCHGKYVFLSTKPLLEIVFSTEWCFMRIEDKVWNVFYNLHLGIMPKTCIKM